MKRHWILLAWAGLLLLMGYGAWVIKDHGFNVRRDLFSVLPESKRDQEFLKAQERFRDGLGRQLIFAVLESKPDQAKANALAFAEHLTKSGLFQDVQSRFGERDATRLYQFYAPFAPVLLSPQKVSDLKVKSESQIVERYLAHFYSPLGGVQVANLSQDPFSLLPDFLMQLHPESGPQVQDGYLLSQHDGKTAVFVFSQIAGDWRDFDLQSQVLQAIDSFKGGTVLRLGLVPYMKAGVEQAKLEISTIGIGSLIGSAVVVLILFRSLIVLLASIALTSICLGISTLLSHAAFGSLHFFTLIFGSSLVGLFVDYSFHFFSQRFEADVENGRQARDKVKTALAYSFFSTVLGFSFLLLTPFPVLREMGAFAIVGFTSASMIIWTFFPLLPHRKLQIRPWWNKMGLGLRGIQKMRPEAFMGFVMFLMILTVALTLNLHFDDNVKQLQGLPKDLKSQDDLIKGLLGSVASSDYFLIRAPTVDAALREEEALLSTLNQKGLGRGYGLSRWIPSREAQEASFAEYQRLKPAIASFYEQIKVPLAKQKQWLKLQEVKFAPLDFQTWRDEFHGLPVAQQDLGKIGDNHYLVLRLESSAHLNELRALNSSTIQFVSPTQDTSEIMSRLRTWIVYAGLSGGCVVFLFLLYMGGLNFAVYNVLAPTISAFLALGLSSLVIGHVNLFNVLAAILVFALTIDYSFFYYDSRKSIAIPTLIAVSACILTTGLSFGLMSLSQTAAISGFGITIAFGIILSYTLSPIALRTK